MGFKTGNQAWKERSTSGRKGRFADPESLWEAATKYFDWVDNNPWLKVEQSHKPFLKEDGSLSYLIELPIARPYTLSGLCSFWNVNQAYWRKFRQSKQLDERFTNVITRIEDIIYIQKFEGAAVGVFNPNIIMRDLGLQNKKQQAGLTANVYVRRDEANGDIVIESLNEQFDAFMNQPN